MAIADKLRKAASLFLVMPEEEDKPQTPPPSRFADMPPAGNPTPENSAADDLDRRLAAMNDTIRQINNGGTTAPPTTIITAAQTTAAQTTPAQPQTIDDLLKRMDGPALTEVAVSSTEVPAPTDGGPLDFNAIYQAAKLPSSPFSAEQTLEMLQSLPQNLPLDVKRMTVNATIATMGKTIGATPETIVADASRKLAALAAYETDHSQKAEASVQAAEAEIAELLATIEAKRQTILTTRQQDATVRSQCDAEADRLDDILEFFSLDVGVSKYAAPDAMTPPPLPPISS